MTYGQFPGGASGPLPMGGSANDDAITALRAIVGNISGLTTALNAFLGISGDAGNITLDAAASTTIANANVKSTSQIILFPTNAAAATLVAGSSSPYVSAKSAGVSFTISTADAGSAAGTETFDYILVNRV